MNKEEATKTLVQILTEDGMINRVAAPATSYYLDNAIAAFPVRETNEDLLYFYGLGPKVEDDIEKLKAMEIEFMKKKGINYLFIQSFYDNNGKLFDLVSAFALVGKGEAEHLKRKFYVNVPEEIREAMETLGINHYIDNYKRYRANDLAFLSEIIPKKPDQSFIGQRVVCVKEYENGVFPGEEGVINQINKDRIGVLWDNYLGERHDNFGPNGHCWWVGHSNIKRMIKEEPIQFAEFVFTLPKEDQNFEANKVLLKNGHCRNIAEIMANEYSSPTFLEYWAVLNDNDKKKVVQAIKKGNEDNSLKIDLEVNWKLYNQGFDVTLDFISLYTIGGDGCFEEYFKSKEKKDQELIIKAILQLPSGTTNKKVNAWLSKNYPKLVEEIGRDNIIEQNGRA